jgi:hypothetical protein
MVLKPELAGAMPAGSNSKQRRVLLKQVFESMVEIGKGDAILRVSDRNVR